MTELDFECNVCKVMFSWPLVDISRSSEIMIDTPNSPYPFQVKIKDSTGFAGFCSTACREKGREAALKAEGVPVPSDRPVCAPIEPCAICHEPVDLHEWHLTYTESTIGADGTVSDFDYLAIVCPSCESKLDLNR